MINGLSLASSPLAPSPSGQMVWLYVGFFALVLLFLALDLGVFHRHAHAVSVKEALVWSIIWITCGLLFTIFVYYGYEAHWMGLGLQVPIVGKPGEFMILDGATAAEQYLTGYIIEKSLSVDNLFVIAMIFSYFAVPKDYQHRVLFWGILGALILRGLMIALGAALIQSFGWITYVFGGFLILTAIKMAFAGEEGINPDQNILVRWLRRFWPVTTDYHGHHFFAPIVDHQRSQRRAATPLFLALLVVEFSDVIFAVDSVPAIFAITGDPFLVLTSNVFAILGLRSLYFLLANMLGRFHYLKPALVLILLFVGTKMLLHGVYKIPTRASLLVVLGLLAGGVAASLLIKPAPEPLVEKMLKDPKLDITQTRKAKKHPRKGIKKHKKKK
jgi:tellurite resistance protein TerC